MEEKPQDLSKWRAGLYDLAGKHVIMCYAPRVECPKDALAIIHDEMPAGTSPRQIPAELKIRLRKMAEGMGVALAED